MSNDVNDVTPSRGETSTLYVAVEVSDRSWGAILVWFTF